MSTALQKKCQPALCLLPTLFWSPQACRSPLNQQAQSRERGSQQASRQQQWKQSGGGSGGSSGGARASGGGTRTGGRRR